MILQDAISMLNFYQDCQLFASVQPSKLYFSSSSFHITAFVTYFVKGFFISLAVIQLLHMQPLNWIINIITKNSTVLLWKNIVEIIHLRTQISKITCRNKLFLVQNNYWNLCQTHEYWLLSKYNCWNLKPKNFKHCSYKLILAPFRATSLFLQVTEG